MIKSELWEFGLPLMEGGAQLHVLTVAKTKKEAAKIFGVSLYYLSKWGYRCHPKSEPAINEPNKKFAYYDGGWLREVKPDWYRVVLPYDDLRDFIRKANKKRFRWKH